MLAGCAAQCASRQGQGTEARPLRVDRSHHPWPPCTRTHVHSESLRSKSRMTLESLSVWTPTLWSECVVVVMLNFSCSDGRRKYIIIIIIINYSYHYFHTLKIIIHYVDLCCKFWFLIQIKYELHHLPNSCVCTYIMSPTWIILFSHYCTVQLGWWRSNVTPSLDRTWTQTYDFLEYGVQLLG